MSDLVSRQAAIKNAHFPMIDDAGYEVVRVNDILALPSVEPKTKCITQIIINRDDMEDLVNEIVDKISKPKTGKWIEENFIPHCSECGRSSVLGGRFCPNCGARMFGEDGDDSE